MKHHYTDAQLESALNKATPIPASSHHVDTLKAALEALPEPTPPDSAELQSFRSFFGRASIKLNAIDGKGDNGSTEDFLQRLNAVYGFAATSEEADAIGSLVQLQGLTASQVLRQALRHYQMTVQGQPMPPPVVDGKTPGQVAFEEYDKISSWSVCLPQYKKHWEAAASAVLAAFGGQASGWKNRAEKAEWECDELRAKAERADIKLKHYEDSFADLENAIKGWNEVSDEPLDDNIRRLVLKYGEAKAELARSAFTLDYVCDTLDTMDIPSVTGESSLSVEQRMDRALDELIGEKKITLSRLRPIAEAGPVPEGAVKVTARVTADGYVINPTRIESITHVAYILLPESSQPVIPAKHIDDSAALGTSVNKILSEIMPAVEAEHDNGQVETTLDMIVPEPATFEAHGKTWTRHTPGDPMPCKERDMIWPLFKGGTMEQKPHEARAYTWGKFHKDDLSIIGWRYADEPTPEPPNTKPWTPAVGDKVQLKGGSFVMTVEQADSDGIACEWHDSNGVPQARTYTPETLQPA